MAGLGVRRKGREGKCLETGEGGGDEQKGDGGGAVVVEGEMHS